MADQPHSPEAVGLKRTTAVVRLLCMMSGEKVATTTRTRTDFLFTRDWVCDVPTAPWICLAPGNLTNGNLIAPPAIT